MRFLWILLIFVGLVLGDTCSDLSTKIDRMEFQRQIDMVNIKNSVELSENRTKSYLDAKLNYLQKDQQSSFSQLEKELKLWVQKETSVYKYAIPFTFLWIGMIALSMYLRFKY